MRLYQRFIYYWFIFQTIGFVMLLEMIATGLPIISSSFLCIFVFIIFQLQKYPALQIYLGQLWTKPNVDRYEYLPLVSPSVLDSVSMSSPHDDWELLSAKIRAERIAQRYNTR